MSASTAGEGGERVPARRVVDLLRARGEMLAVAESCTGGGLGRDITEEAGVSDVFWGGLLVYADDAKVRLAGVSEDLLARHGAVSAEVAVALAEGLRSLAGTEWSVSITGVAGPGGGSPAKPVGTVWIAVAGADGTSSKGRRFGGDRGAVRAASVDAALADLLARLEAP